MSAEDRTIWKEEYRMISTFPRIKARWNISE
jgi:hypothetical protein